LKSGWEINGNKYKNFTKQQEKRDLGMFFIKKAQGEQALKWVFSKKDLHY